MSEFYKQLVLMPMILGPPPLDQEKIAEIPKREITQEQVDSKLQCSVCWDDFALTEVVRELPCLVRNPSKLFPFKLKLTLLISSPSIFITSRASYRG